MKIKNILPFVFSTLVLTSVSLIGQNTSAGPSAPALHVGTSNPYKIGTSDDPVTVDEYCAYLNTKAVADLCKDDRGHYIIPVPYHYDSSFMVVRTWIGIGPTACIKRTGWPHVLGWYSYSAIAGCNKEIIDGVQSQQVQEEFNAWRQNPLTTELCDYMSAEISGDTATSMAIKDRYSKTNPPILDQLTQYANNYKLYRQSQWYYLPTPFIGGINRFTSRRVTDSVFFFQSTGFIYASQDNQHPSRKFTTVYCDYALIDECNRVILLSNHDASGTITVQEGTEYFRPSCVVGVSEFTQEVPLPLNQQVPPLLPRDVADIDLECIITSDGHIELMLPADQ